MASFYVCLKFSLSFNSFPNANVLVREREVSWVQLTNYCWKVIQLSNSLTSSCATGNSFG